MSPAARVLVVLLAALRPQPRAVLPALWALVLAAGFAWPEGAFAQVSCVGEPMLPLEFGDGMLYRANQTPDD